MTRPKADSIGPLHDWITFFEREADQEENVDAHFTARTMRQLALDGDAIGLHLAGLVQLAHAEDCTRTVINRVDQHMTCTTCGHCTTVPTGEAS